MKTGDTAGHEIANGEEKDKNRKLALEALKLAKKQHSCKKGHYVWNPHVKAYFFNIN